MQTKIQKWGNSLGVRLPKAVTTSQSLRSGSTVRVSTDQDKIVIEKVHLPRPTLKALVAGITKDNKPDAVDWGKPRGKEVW